MPTLEGWMRLIERVMGLNYQVTERGLHPESTLEIFNVLSP